MATRTPETSAGSTRGPSIHRTARDIAREEITRAIVARSRTQLSSVGPSELSLRAVARELGMVSSAVYRYFPSRDNLITALVIEIYDELGDVVQAADAAVRRRQDFEGRWLALARGVHEWAREHPHDYALVYGSPVPGYAAPQTTIEPSARVTVVLLNLLIDIQQAGRTPEAIAVPRAVHRAMRELRATTEDQIGDDLLIRGLQAWGGLLGAINLELFGHLVGAVDDHQTYFEHLARRLCPV